MEAFADGVFAIAFTLPIFNIVLPEARSGSALLSQHLLDIWPHYISYLLASLIIGLYWVHHHFSGAIYRTTGHWFLIATAIFLTMIGFVAFPARVFAEHLNLPADREAASQYLVFALAAVSLTWLLKWRVGLRRDHVDRRLDPAYIHRLNRRYRRLCAWKVTAAVLCLFSWQVGLAMAALGLAFMVLPPETPRYLTEAPPIEGEES